MPNLVNFFIWLILVCNVESQQQIFSNNVEEDKMKMTQALPRGFLHKKATLTTSTSGGADDMEPVSNEFKEDTILTLGSNVHSSSGTESDINGASKDSSALTVKKPMYDMLHTVAGFIVTYLVGLVGLLINAHNCANRSSNTLKNIIEVGLWQLLKLRIIKGRRINDIIKEHEKTKAVREDGDDLESGKAQYDDETTTEVGDVHDEDEAMTGCVAKRRVCK